MSDWPPHPDDEWIEITGMGAHEPEFIMGFSGADREIGAAKAKYVAGLIEIEEFEAVVDRVASGAPMKEAA